MDTTQTAILATTQNPELAQEILKDFGINDKRDDAPIVVSTQLTLHCKQEDYNLFANEVRRFINGWNARVRHEHLRNALGSANEYVKKYSPHKEDQHTQEPVYPAARTKAREHNQSGETALMRRLYTTYRKDTGIRLNADELATLLFDEALGTRISNAAALCAGVDPPGSDCTGNCTLMWNEFVEKFRKER